MASRYWLTIFVVALSFETSSVFAQPYVEPGLKPGQHVSDVRAIACNTPDQLETILEAYSAGYQTGKAAFEAKQAIIAHDAAMGRQAPVCDEVRFTAIVVVRSVSSRHYDVHFADGCCHRRYIIEAKPVGPD